MNTTSPTASAMARVTHPAANGARTAPKPADATSFEAVLAGISVAGDVAIDQTDTAAANAAPLPDTPGAPGSAVEANPGNATDAAVPLALSEPILAAPFLEPPSARVEPAGDAPQGLARADTANDTTSWRTADGTDLRGPTPCAVAQELIKDWGAVDAAPGLARGDGAAQRASAAVGQESMRQARTALPPLADAAARAPARLAPARQAALAALPAPPAPPEALQGALQAGPTQARTLDALPAWAQTPFASLTPSPTLASTATSTSAPEPGVVRPSGLENPWAAAQLPFTSASSTLERIVTLAAHPASRQWPGEFTQRMEVLVKEGVQRAELQLHPADLGPISVQITITDQRTTMVLLAEHDETRRAIERALPQLREALADSGLHLSDATVGQQAQHAPGEAPSRHQRRSEPERRAFDLPAALAPRRVTASIGLIDTYA